jgi:hypothetical protein
MGCVYNNTGSFYEKYFERKCRSSTASQIAQATKQQIANGRWTGYPNFRRGLRCLRGLSGRTVGRSGGKGSGSGRSLYESLRAHTFSGSILCLNLTGCTEYGRSVEDESGARVSSASITQFAIYIKQRQDRRVPKHPSAPPWSMLEVRSTMGGGGTGTQGSM